ncbi:hypothetical protein AZE42_05838 [Rhizopogon vesiculosus]|uniref:Uncharacterized protein n=1 Tax=Rhizopogon vesiculosus TaxID=180088 RepID=A0A1J8PU78_9AGAM|nr:hypothetical protein AZE42_05838 [Rhizopogon vesiculosus]
MIPSVDTRTILAVLSTIQAPSSWPSAAPTTWKPLVHRQGTLVDLY